MPRAQALAPNPSKRGSQTQSPNRCGDRRNANPTQFSALGEQSPGTLPPPGETSENANRITPTLHPTRACSTRGRAGDSSLASAIPFIVSVHRLELRLQIDRSLDRDQEVHRLIEKIDELLHREFSEYDAGLIAHPDEIEIEEHE